MLVLQKSIKEATREELEAHIEQVRAKRMVAAVEYHSLRNEKFAKKGGKLGERVEKQLDMLERELTGLDNALARVDNRMATIEALKQEMGTVIDQIIDPNDEGEY